MTKISINLEHFKVEWLLGKIFILKKLIIFKAQLIRIYDVKIRIETKL